MTGKFTFATREEGFDNHIDGSIRGYGHLWQDVVDISQYFVENNTSVVDIGCSTGKMLKSMIEQNTFAPDAIYEGVEIEEDFYKGYIKDEQDYPQLSYYRGDVMDFNFTKCSYVTSIFTLQFMSYASRKKVVEKVYDGLLPDEEKAEQGGDPSRISSSPGFRFPAASRSLPVIFLMSPRMTLVSGKLRE